MPAAALKHYGGMVVDDTPKGQGQRKNAPYRMPRGVRRAQRRYSPQRAPRFLRASQPPLLTWRLPVCVDAAATMSGTSDEQADRCWTSTRESVRKRSAAPCWLGHSAGSYRLCAPLLRALRTGFGAATHLALRCFFAQLVCRSEPDEHGVQVNKCERTRQVLRHCAGRCDLPLPSASSPPPERARLRALVSALASASAPRRPDEVIESSREVTDGKPLEAIDGAFMRPLFGEARARDFSDALSGFSDMMRVAEKMQRAVTELLPGAWRLGACAEAEALTQRRPPCCWFLPLELEEAMPRFGGERGLQSRSALPRGSDGGEEAKKKKPPPPPQSTSYDEV